MQFSVQWDEPGGGSPPSQTEWCKGTRHMLNSSAAYIHTVKREENGSSVNLAFLCVSWSVLISGQAMSAFKKKKKKMLHFIELPSVQCLRAVRGGKKYLQWYYSSLAVCMSACYPRLGQNTPLVQTREKRKKKKRESNKKAKHNSSTSQSWHRRPTTHHSHGANTNWPCSNNIKRKG